MALKTSLLEMLVCPRDHQELTEEEGSLVCPTGHRYPVVDDVPVLLLDDVRQTMDLVQSSLKQAGKPQEGLFLESVGLTEDEKKGIEDLETNGTLIDPVVSYLVGATNGIGYKEAIGRLREYPIPVLPVPPGKGELLLDIGCNWGRWCFAAVRKGYRPIGLDPSLGAVMAGKRVARQFGYDVQFIVGDGRFLPFRDGVFQHIFSYSVIQHFSREDARQSFEEAARVLEEGGLSVIQMPNRNGLRCLYHQARRGFREGKGFEVRYWSPAALRGLAQSTFGPTRTTVDCFFGLGLKYEDRHLMAPRARYATLASEALRRVSTVFPPLTLMADSLYLNSVKQ